jgi:hypothetical protein
MAITVSKHEAKHAIKRLEGLKRRVANIREKAEASAGKMIRTAETGGAAFAAGVIQGRTGGIEIVGVPFELLAGSALNVLGYFGGAGKHSDHLNNIGDGFLAAYLTTLGRGVGAQMLAKTSQAPQVDTKAQPQIVNKGTRLTADEIAMAAERAAVE